VVSCSGFQTSTQVFRHDRFRHSAIIVMVRTGHRLASEPQNNWMQLTGSARCEVGSRRPRS
jgi:hypothetical protein